MKLRRTGIQKAAAIGLIGVAGGLGLVGCSADSNSNSSGTSQSQDQKNNENLTAAKASEFMKNYYHKVVEASDGANDDYTSMQEAVNEAVPNPEDQQELSQYLNNPKKFVEKLNDDQASKLLPKVEELDKLKDTMNWDGLNDKEKTYLHIMNVGIPNGYMFYKDKGLDVNVPEDKIKLSDDHNSAEIDVKDMEFKSGDEKIPSEGFSIKHFKLVNTNGEWKIDGKDFLDVITKYMDEARDQADKQHSEDPNLEETK